MIKVEDAISNLQNQIMRFEKGTEPDLALEMAIEALQERKTGKWIDHSEDGYAECSLCGHLTTCEGNIENLHYCFWCGARLTAADPCDNDCEHCDWATCPKEEGDNES